MKAIFDNVSVQCSIKTTKAYSTSFSLGIRMLGKKIRNPIYSIYGFVRFADEIVDSFHDYDKKKLLDQFEADTYQAIDEKISLNPILNAFQAVYHEYNLDIESVQFFLKSMRMDLEKVDYDSELYDEYILGSAEVVGLMCLKVFVNGDDEKYKELKPYAQKLGSAFQKINFLRDLHADFLELGRTYFPELEMQNFDDASKAKIEEEIQVEFEEALVGIKMLPQEARLGVYVAYVYYYRLFKKIESLPSRKILEERIRIPNQRKFTLVLSSYLKHSLNLL